MTELKHINGQAEFDAATRAAKVVLIDFTATWCGPCRALGPILEQLATEYPPAQVQLFKVDVDQNNALARKFNISAVPAVGIFKDGKQHGSLVIGLRQKGDYKAAIDDLLK
ncbi:MAG: thioredoxin family protein [Candidatus Lokiarchaeota archaeon]|nr:thioredoxin family protein [Candidatus Lokiarchaeota archaeon]